MIGSRVSRPLLALALFITPNVVLGQSGGPAQDETTPACPTSRAIPPIPANAEKVANAIGIMPLVQRVRVLDSGCSQAGATSVEELALRQQITEAVFTALDVNEVFAEIDCERAKILEMQARLSRGRDRMTYLLALANIVAGTGTGVVGTAM